MKAYRKTERAPGNCAVYEVPVPEPRHDQVVLKVSACGVCGSDLHAYNYDPGYEWMAMPVTLGHEFGGEVVAVGAGVEGVQVGEWYLTEAIQYCGKCETCRSGNTHLCKGRWVQGLHRDGGMAEYVAVDARFLLPVPKGVGFPAAAMVEPLSVAVHGVVDNTRIQPGDQVVVTGPGIIGMLSAQVARTQGGRVLVVGAPQDQTVRLSRAAALGFQTAVLDGSESLADLSQRVLGGQPDVCLECSGASPALAGTLDAVRPGGQVTAIGMYARPVEWFFTTAVRKEIRVHGSYASVRHNYLTAGNLLTTGAVQVEPLIQRYGLGEAGLAFEDAFAKRVLKPVLVP